MTQTKIKYHKFDIGDTLEYRGKRYQVAGLRPGYYIMNLLKLDSGFHELNSSFVEMGFEKVKTFEDELNEL